MCYIVLPVFWDAVVKVEINVALKNVKMIQWNASTVEKDLSVLPEFCVWLKHFSFHIVFMNSRSCKHSI